MEGIASFIGWANGWIWSTGMLVLIAGTGIVFTVGLGFFQFVHHKDMWSRVLDKGDSASGISTFAAFCTTMAMRIGTGNVAGVAVAIYRGGPGALLWMILIGCTNAAVTFVECTLGQLYKIRIDGEYRGSGAYCAERGLGWKPYGVLLALALALGAGFLMPAAATYTICDGFRNAWGVPMWVISAAITVLLGVVIIGGIKRIGQFASYVVPVMTVIYIALLVIILVLNIARIPGTIGLIFSSAFNQGAVMGGVEGGLMAALLQGIKRGTFSSAAGMGESTPGASAAETSHPVKQGMANAAGVFLDTVIVCTATGLMILLTDCFNTSPDIGGYVGQGTEEMAALAAEGTSGVIFVQLATKQVIGGIAPTFVAVMLMLFSFTCLISYYYESETSFIYLFQGEEKAKTRKTVIWGLRIIMLVLVFIWGISDASLAWDAADLALGSVTWINVIMLWFLFPKARAMYRDYEEQMAQKKDPYYNPDKPGLCWKGVDADLWREINKDRIAADK